MIYCMVQQDLAGRTERALRRYGEDAGVTVLTERRERDRRGRADERRSGLVSGSPVGSDRRKVRNASGLRIAERRATLVPVPAPASLPRRLRPFAESFEFLEPLRVAREHAEDISTARLVARIQAGEDTLFAAVYERYFDRVYTFLGVLLENEAEAEWITQETFFELHARIVSYNAGPIGVREQIASAARNQAVRRLRKGRGIDPDELAEGVVARRESGGGIDLPDWITDTDLLLLIGRLPLPQRQALLLRYLFRLSDHQAARVLDLEPESLEELEDGAHAFLRERLALLGRETTAPSLRLSMVSGRRPARVVRSRQLALHAS